MVLGERGRGLPKGQRGQRQREGREGGRFGSRMDVGS